MEAVEKHTNATFYQYKLLKKISYPNSLIHSLLLAPLIWLIAETIIFGWMTILFMLLAAVIAYWFQYVISRSVLIIISHSYRKRWRHLRKMPWIGYLPEQFVTFTTFRKVWLHSAWIGLCLIAVLLPWSPASLVTSLFFWHLWLLFPRFYAFIGLRKQPKGGMIKLNPQDVSYYMP